jgi:protein transport protein SEC61 subunit gamma and related proteins
VGTERSYLNRSAVTFKKGILFQLKMGDFKSFLAECKRVLLITRKPSPQEYKDLIKITGLGLIIIGFVGFVVQVLYVLIFQ